MIILVLIGLAISIAIPVGLFVLATHYVFSLRKKQNDQFIVDLIDALRKENLSKPD